MDAFFRRFTRSALKIPGWYLAVCALALCGSCAKPTQALSSEITVGAAANLTDAFGEVGKAFLDETGVRVVFSYASTAQLAQQIRNSAPFDVFAAADTEHVDELVRDGVIAAESRAIYARGVLALWIPKAEASGISDVGYLASPKIRTVAIATPSAAPYGKAAVEALGNAAIWNRVEQKVVYANNISMAKQFAQTGNADAAFTALSLVLKEGGKVIRVDQSLYSPIDQALGVIRTSRKAKEARKFTAFLAGPRGKEILQRYGYLIPHQQPQAAR